MTIHLISTCSDPMLEAEFVRPISRIASDWTREHGNTFEIMVHHATDIPVATFSTDDSIIICGTAFQDDEYLKNIQAFQWLGKTTCKVLGICSGMQILALVLGARLIPGLEIGMVEIETNVENPLCEGTFAAYNLHKHSLADLSQFQILAHSKETVQVIGHESRPQYGVLFHPEVRQEGVVTRFLNLNP